MKSRQFYLLICTVLFSGCLPTSDLERMATATAPLTTATANHTPLPPSIEPVNKFPLTQDCLVVQDSIPQEQLPSGYLIVNSKTDSQINPEDIYAIDLANQEKISLAEKNGKITRFQLNSYTISPDRKWFVYFVEDTNERSILRLRTIENHYQASPYWDSNWGDSAIWVNSKQLFIPPNQTRQIALVLNPFTGEWHELESAFPSGLNFAFPYFYYSPNLSSAIYVSGDNYVLWDADSNNDIWIKATLAPYLAPKWSVNGNYVAMIVDPEGNIQEELVLVDQQGKEANLTGFAQDALQGNSMKIITFEWSPDNQHIAFSAEIGSNSNPVTYSTLFVIDVLSGEAVDYCIPVKNASNIVWSPYGKQLIIESIGQNDQQTSNVILVDIVQGWAAKLTQGIQPLGWMVSP